VINGIHVGKREATIGFIDIVVGHLGIVNAVDAQRRKAYWGRTHCMVVFTKRWIYSRALDAKKGHVMMHTFSEGYCE